MSITNKTLIVLTSFNLSLYGPLKKKIVCLPLHCKNCIPVLVERTIFNVVYINIIIFEF